MVNLALYQPEIPQNTGALMRLCACLGMNLEVIHPCGFVWNDRHLRRAGMDYADKATVRHHSSWEEFYQKSQNSLQRLILLDTRAETPYTDFSFEKGDTLLMGQESSGVPDSIFPLVPHRLFIPMASGCRSLNIALAAAMVVGEALRQLHFFKGKKP